MSKAVTAVAALFMACSLFAQDDPKKAEKEAEARAKKKIEEFKAKIKTCKTPDEQAEALGGLADEPHDLILKELKNWVSKPAQNIREAAVEEIGKFAKNAKAASLLVSVARADKVSDVSEMCLEEVAKIGARAVAKEIPPFFTHKELQVSRQAVNTLGTLKSKDSIDPLIALIFELEVDRDRIEQNRQGQQAGGQGPGPQVPGNAQPAQDMETEKRINALLPAAQEALKAITGQGFTTGAEWKAWWVKNKSSFKELD